MIQYLLSSKKEGVKEQEIRRKGAEMWRTYSGHPRKVFRILVFFACCIAVLFQLTQCFRKLTNPPISTRSRVTINDSMAYPSITICRSPSYKVDVLKKYGLGDNIRWTSEWKNFPFHNATLTEFWDEATFNEKETFLLYGLNRRLPNVEVRSSLFYLSGQCHTLIPLTETATAGIGVGYSLLLRHTDPKADEAGWEVFLHEPKEPWSETGKSRSSEGVWLETGEEMHLKITAQHITTISHNGNRCHLDLSYSENECQMSCRMLKLSGKVGCSAPWMRSGNKTWGSKKECEDFQSTRALVSEYLRQGGLSSSFNLENETQQNGDAYGCQASCLRPCQVTQYTIFVVNRKSIEGSQEKRGGWEDVARQPREGDKVKAAADQIITFSKLKVFYSSKIVTMVEENWGYDFSQFVADAGGSLGFLLGMSVVGAVALLEQLAEAMVAQSSGLGKGSCEEVEGSKEEVKGTSKC